MRGYLTLVLHVIVDYESDNMTYIKFNIRTDGMFNRTALPTAWCEPAKPAYEGSNTSVGVDQAKADAEARAKQERMISWEARAKQERMISWEARAQEDRMISWEARAQEDRIRGEALVRAGLASYGGYN
jgi:hypothetical protein